MSCPPPPPSPLPPGGNWMRRFHELAYLADKTTLDLAKMSNTTMTLQVRCEGYLNVQTLNLNP